MRGGAAEAAHRAGARCSSPRGAGPGAIATVSVAERGGATGAPASF
jgi:hypothetical protein